MSKTKLFITILVLLSITVFAYVNKGVLLLRWQTLKAPCGMIFLDEPKPWSLSQKEGVLKACAIYKRTGLWTQFLSPLYVSLYEGFGGANSSKDFIVFKMSGIQNEKEFYSVASHEIAHVIDIRSGELSKKFEWLNISGWTCFDRNDLNSCTHPCKQSYDKQFYCSYRYFETLPSRFGSLSYDPEKTDVSINPMEDFAESSRYFLNANDALTLTSKSRCEYFMRLFRNLEEDSCYDCNPETVCK
jgi:hypothetical protein